MPCDIHERTLRGASQAGGKLRQGPPKTGAPSTRPPIGRLAFPGERFLSAQADAFAGANAEEKASACSVRNDGGRCADEVDYFRMADGPEVL